MVYIGIAVFIALLGMLLYVIFYPRHDYMAELEENTAKLEAQIKSYNEFEIAMAKIYEENGW